MRTVAEIQAEIDSFEASFRDWPVIPAGTENRKHLQREAIDTAHARACLPENVTERLALIAERKAAKRSETGRKTAARLAADPEHQERQRIFRELRKLGFKREYTSGRSAYYSRGGFQVRISDHDVPMTAEREWNQAVNGFRTWASSRWSFVIGGDDVITADEWLADVVEKIEAKDEEV